MAAQAEQFLKPFLEPLQAGEPVSHANLTLLPLRGNGQGAVDYRLAAEAIADGTLVVTEVDESGSVPDLLVKSTTDELLLLLDGEELLGARQNRILNSSILLPARAEATIPVSCVEEGRWHHTSQSFASGSYSPSRLRARKSRDVGLSLRATGRAVSDQSAVWEEVSSVMEATASSSGTLALSDAVDQRRESLDGYVAALPCPEGARGVVAAIGGRFVAVDLFDRPATLRRVWPRLVAGYALDAIASLDEEPQHFGVADAQTVLEEVGGVPCQPCPSVGLGQDWRFESPDLLGHALVVDDTCLHLSAFPNHPLPPPPAEDLRLFDPD